MGNPRMEKRSPEVHPQSTEFPPVMYPNGWGGQKTLRFLSPLITESFKYEVNKTYTKFKLI